MVVAQSLPFQSSGTSVVLRHLLENFASDEVVLLARNPNPHMRLESHPLHYPAVRIPAIPSGLRGERYWRLSAVLPGIVAGLREIRRRRPSAIMAVFPDEISLGTGYWLHRLTRLPLLAYFCDLYMEDRPSGWEARLARWLQPRVFGSAARVIVLNEGMAEFYRQRYGLEPVCLPTCVNRSIPEMVTLPQPKRPFVVGYSGNVNATRLSSLRALVRAIGDNPSYRIRYFTPQRPDFLRTHGIWAGNASAAFIGDEEDLLRELAGCDVLFLPLTFDVNENSYEQLSTCFGTKSYEYFLSQRPVLLHAPGDYFIARFYRQWNCGLVVDDPEPEALLAALERLQSDGGLRALLVRNALKATRQFEGRRVVAILRAVLSGKGSMVEAG